MNNDGEEKKGRLNERLNICLTFLKVRNHDRFFI